MADSVDKEEVKELEVIPPVVDLPEIMPPVYSREVKLFGCVLWSVSCKLDEEAFYNRIAGRINEDLAKEVLILRAAK